MPWHKPVDHAINILINDRGVYRSIDDTGSQFRSLLDRISLHPSEASDQDVLGRTILHMLVGCHRKKKCHTPIDVVKKVYCANPRAAVTPDNWGRSPLHLAADRSSKDVVKFLLTGKEDCVAYKVPLVALHPSAAGNMRENDTGWTALHSAIIGSKLDNAKLIVSHCPNTANTADCEGRSPLFILENHSRYKGIINNAINYKPTIMSRQRADALLSLPKNDEILYLPKNFVGGEHVLLKIWELASLIVRVVYHGKDSIAISEEDDHQEILPNGRKWRAVHACLGMKSCPLLIINLALELFPGEFFEVDEDGNYPLHFAAAANNSINSNIPYSPEGNNKNKGDMNSNSKKKHSQLQRNHRNSAILLLRKVMQINPRAARKVNNMGRTPLAIALCEGGIGRKSAHKKDYTSFKRWKKDDCIIREVYELFPRAATFMDPISKMYPFMVAASSTSDMTIIQADTNIIGSLDLDMVYTLFREDPALFLSHVSKDSL
eukprot:CAMPEP_0194420450 /NCGR_PEP_ID=MMETSP0176-20130528/19730_1 /TAXON_ID=216777 /ORGANISM="Proboscia alata, Strain PI-D3" /LENGTH=490 /DNA_ID=CAMNT_0039228065 /DNA_START=32 /DNA_END=1504 /DNA_ORIENTATION=+